MYMNIHGRRPLASYSAKMTSPEPSNKTDNSAEDFNSTVNSSGAEFFAITDTSGSFQHTDPDAPDSDLSSTTPESSPLKVDPIPSPTQETLHVNTITKLSQIDPSPVAGNSTLLLVLAIVVAVCASPFYFKPQPSPQTSTTRIDLRSAIRNASVDIPHQTLETWATFHSGIEDVHLLSRPSVFILTYQDSPATAEVLAKRVAKIASLYLHAPDTEPLELTVAQLGAPKFQDDHGRVISVYKPFLIEKRAMIVYNLHQIPGTVARAFHCFCDEVTPLVERSVIIFTLKMNQYKGNLLESTETRLKELWRGDMKNDILMPLITRLTGSVLKVI